jgi:hypothetical protein
MHAYVQHNNFFFTSTWRFLVHTCICMHMCNIQFMYLSVHICDMHNIQAIWVYVHTHIYAPTHTHTRTLFSKYTSIPDFCTSSPHIHLHTHIHIHTHIQYTCSTWIRNIYLIHAFIAHEYIHTFMHIHIPRYIKCIHSFTHMHTLIKHTHKYKWVCIHITQACFSKPR